MGEFISFDTEYYPLHGPLQFIVTGKGMMGLAELCDEDPDSILFDFLNKRKYLIRKDYQGNYYVSLGEELEFRLALDKQSNKKKIRIISTEEMNFQKHNQYLKEGKLFILDDDAKVYFVRTVHGFKPLNLYKKNESSLPRSLLNEEDLYPGCSLRDIETIERALKKKEETEEEKVELGEKTLEILDTAKEYAELSFEIERKNALDAEKMVYEDFYSVIYDRKDRNAYAFRVHNYDENIYQTGVQVQLKNYKDEIINAEIIKYLDNEQCVVLLFNKELSKDIIPESGIIELSTSYVNYEVQTAAIDMMKSGRSKNKYFGNIIDGKYRRFSNQNLTDLYKELNDQKYPPNNSQMNAIFKGIQTNDIFLVMGPPGTGKTTVIKEWVRYFVEKEHKRVLISSQNNKAVDNVLERFTNGSIESIRIGSESKVQKNVLPLLFENKVSSMRKKIESSTQSNIKKISSALFKMNDTVNSILTLEEYEKKLIQFHDSIKLKGKEYFKNDYKKLMDVRANQVHLKKEICEIRANIQKNRNYLKEKKELTGFFKAFYFLPLMITQNKTQKIILDVNRKIDAYNNLNVQGNKLVRALKKKITAFQKNIFDVFYKDTIELRQMMKDAKNLCKNNVLLLSKEMLFNPIENYYDIQEIHTRRKEIENLFNKYLKLYKVLQQWAEDLQTQNYFLEDILLNSVDVVGATCIGIKSQRRFADLDFDVTIIDEAGQIQIHNVLVPLSVSDKAILLGDHKQIPPMVDEDLLSACEELDICTDMLEKSFFEILYENIRDDNKIMLDTQYRMPKCVADVLSQQFYDGKYISPDFKAGSAVLQDFLTFDTNPFIVIDTSDIKGRFEKRGEMAGYSNSLETYIVEKLLSQFTVELSRDNIGIISAYANQVNVIKERLKNRFDSDDLQEMVATLDSFQGQERDIIVYSFTRSNKRPNDQRRIGFLSELRRLNVAMSRCKKLLILIGDMKFLSSCQYFETDDVGNEIMANNEKAFSEFIVRILEACQRNECRYYHWLNLEKILNGGYSNAKKVH